jgi:dephospho-CoA kinase
VRVIAITGGIGSGKSTVTAQFRKLGVPAVDADAISRSLTAAEGEALAPIREAFGDAVFAADGALDRMALAKAVFSGNTEALSTLNHIMHPLITQRVYRELQGFKNVGEPVVLLDVPLLFETGMDRLADAVICVTAPEKVRIRRVSGRVGMSREQAVARVRSQNTAQRTESLSDYVLSTDAPIAQTRQKALELWTRVLAEGPRRPSEFR